MAANEPALLIFERPRGRLRIEPMDELDRSKLDAPLGWLVLGRFRNAEFLDSSLRLSRVERAKIAGLAGPSLWGGFDFSYVLLMLLGWLTLSTPILVRVALAEERQLTLDEVRTYIGKIVQESQLLSDVKAKLGRRIQRATSVADMAKAIDDARE